MQNKSKSLALAVILLVFVPVWAVWGNDDVFSRVSLRGLYGVAVAINDLPPEIEQIGFTKEQLETDVEIKLRTAGIKAIPTGDLLLRVPGRPYLLVSINAIITPFDLLLAYNVDIELKQETNLKRNPSLEAHTGTWSRSILGAVGKEKTSEIRSKVKDLVDFFINAYLSVNR